MRRLCFILMFCTTALCSCQKAEFVSDSFIEDALEGVVQSTEKQKWDGLYPAKYSYHCDLIFYADGTCRQCYIKTKSPNVSYITLYHTLFWEIDAIKKSITLTDRKLLESNPETAIGVLKIKKYKDHIYKLVGTLPTSDSQSYKEVEINGVIGDSELRAVYEERYVSEDEFEK